MSKKKKRDVAEKRANTDREGGRGMCRNKENAASSSWEMSEFS